MPLATDDLDRYRTDGFLSTSGWFSEQEITALKAEAAALASIDSPARVLERDGQTVRALHGCHLTSDRFRRLTQLPRLVLPVVQVLDEPVYVYQFKINFKAAFSGDVWKWHQDYIYWRNEDGMVAPAAINVVIFLDAVNEFNGPLMLIRGSHTDGLIETGAAKAPSGNAATPWIQNFTVDLKYSLDPAVISKLVGRGEIVAPKGPAGTAVMFHPNLAHASAPNLSPFDRTVVIITYNSVGNVPATRSQPRPEFLVSRDTRAVTPLAQDALV